MVLTDEAVWAEYADKPYNLHGLIADNKLEQIKKFTSELKLSANEIVSEKGQVYSVKVPAYGARVVALSMTKAEQNKLEMDGKLSITAGGDACADKMSVKAGRANARSDRFCAGIPQDTGR